MKVVLLLQNRQLIACQVGYGRASVAVTFEDSSSDVERFRQFLEQHRHTEFVVVLDLEGEQLHLQQIPRMSGRDQNSILRHHQRKLFGDSLYTSAIVGNRKTHAEARLGVSLIGLPAEYSECVWLTELADVNPMVRSFHWMSLLIYPLADATGMASTLTVFVIRMQAGDDRIMGFAGRQPLICRRLGEPSGTVSQTDESGTLLADQLQQTFAYLERETESVGLQAYDEKSVSVVALGDFTTEERQAIDQQLNVLGISPGQSMPASSLKKSAGAESASVAELMATSVLRGKSYSYSLIVRGARYLERRLRHAMVACGISLIFSAAMASAAARYVEADLGQLELMANQVEVQALTLRQAHAHPEWSDQYAIEAIREAVGHVNAIEMASQSTPFHFLASLSEHLTRHPAIELKSIQWAGIDSEKHNDIHKDPDGPLSTIGERRYHAVLSGEVELTSEGYRPAMSQFRSFVASIRESVIVTSPSAVVTIVNLPFSEAGSVASVTGSSQGGFILEVSSSRLVP